MSTLTFKMFFFLLFHNILHVYLYIPHFFFSVTVERTPIGFLFQYEKENIFRNSSWNWHKRQVTVKNSFPNGHFNWAVGHSDHIELIELVMNGVKFYNAQRKQQCGAFWVSTLFTTIMLVVVAAVVTVLFMGLTASQSNVSICHKCFSCG